MVEEEEKKEEGERDPPLPLPPLPQQRRRQQQKPRQLPCSRPLARGTAIARWARAQQGCLTFISGMVSASPHPQSSPMT